MTVSMSFNDETAKRKSDAKRKIDFNVTRGSLYDVYDYISSTPIPPDISFLPDMKSDSKLEKPGYSTVLLPNRLHFGKSNISKLDQTKVFHILCLYSTIISVLLFLLIAYFVGVLFFRSNQPVQATIHDDFSKLEGELNKSNESLADCRKRVQDLMQIEKKNPECETSGNALPQNFGAPLQRKAKCQIGWSYHEGTNFCYYHQNYTYDDTGKLNTYSWQLAEEICERNNAHLVSIHSVEEKSFVAKMIGLNLTSLHRKGPSENRCNDNSPYYAWSGMHVVDGYRKWSDDTADDFFSHEKTGPNQQWVLCKDNSNVNVTSLLYIAYKNPLPRFVCKKPANEMRR